MVLHPSAPASAQAGRLQWWPMLLLGLFLLGLAGCYGPSALERDYGNAWAYNQAVAIVNPQAGLVETPAVGLSPTASKNVMESYNKTFSGQKSGGVSQTTINLGGLTTAGGGGGGGSSGSGGN